MARQQAAASVWEVPGRRPFAQAFHKNAQLTHYEKTALGRFVKLLLPGAVQTCKSSRGAYCNRQQHCRNHYYHGEFL